MFNKQIEERILKRIASVAKTNSVPVWVIGGYVRDILLERDSKDIDIVVLGSGIDLARSIAAEIGKGAEAKYYKNFGTAMLRMEGHEVEFVGARKESYRSDSRKPIVEDGSLEEPLRPSRHL